MKFTIPVKPRTKKNHGRIVMMGRYPRLLPSKQYIEFEGQVVDYVTTTMSNLEPIDYPINLKCVFYKEADRRGDLVGYLQAIQDALVKAGVLKDDNHKIVETTDGSEVKLDRKNPRIEIEIERKV